MDNEESARELTKVIIRPLSKMIEYIIEERCRISVLEILNNIEQTMETKQ